MIENSLPPHHASAKSILIVDDNADAAEALAESLKIYGYEVYIAHDGSTAIEQARRLHPEVMILDIGMPTMSGYEVAQSIRATAGAHSPMLIAVTGYTQQSDRITAHQAGFEHYFAKPLDIRKLTAVLKDAGTASL